MSEPLDPIFVVVSCYSFLSQPRRAHSRDLIDFAGWHRQKVIQITTKAQLRDSLCPPVSLSTYNVLFFLLINIPHASLLSDFVEILFCKAEGLGPLSLTTGLVARIWGSYHSDLASISG